MPLYTPRPQDIPGYLYRRGAGAVYQLPMFPSSSSASSLAHTVNVEHAQPFIVSRAEGLPVANVSVNVATAVTNAAVRIGFRATDPTTGMPGALLFDLTSAAALAAATTGVKTTTAGTVTLPLGQCWLTICSQTAAATLSNVVGNHPSIQRFAFNTAATGQGQYTSAATVTGALPSTPPSWTATAMPTLAALNLA